jgi:hypothetical protein
MYLEAITVLAYRETARSDRVFTTKKRPLFFSPPKILEMEMCKKVDTKNVLIR